MTDNRKVLRAHWPPRKYGNRITVDLSAEIYSSVYLAAHDKNHSLADEVRERLSPEPPKNTGTVADIADEELLRRAVSTATTNGGPRRASRWVAVMDRFGLGSTYAQQLCARFGLDPDEIVRRQK